MQFVPLKTFFQNKTWIFAHDECTAKHSDKFISMQNVLK